VHPDGLEQGRLRDSRPPIRTTYTGAIETAEEFGKRIYLEAWNRGWSRAERKGVMGDGVAWIWKLAHQHFPGAVQIVDLYHASQHLWDLARRLYPNHPSNQNIWMKAHQKRLLDKGKIKSWFSRCALPNQPTPRSWKRSASRQITSSAMPSVCVTQSSAVSICSSVQA
jgi:hypothetical protein